VNTRVALFRLRVVSTAEAISFLLLLSLGSVLKRATDGDVDLVLPLGLLHGVLFVAFVLLWADAWNKVRWDLKRAALYFVSSVIPFAGFYAERRLKAEQERIAAAEPAAAAA
jgi:integral membrane protein